MLRRLVVHGSTRTRLLAGRCKAKFRTAAIIDPRPHLLASSSSLSRGFSTWWNVKQAVSDTSEEQSPPEAADNLEEDPVSDGEEQHEEGEAAGFCFDAANEYQIVEWSELQRQDRLTDAVLSPPMQISNESESLIQLLPDHLAQKLADCDTSKLTEIVMDVGRRPWAWIAGERHFLGDSTVTQEQILLISEHLQFGSDNCAGINGCLHSVAAIRSRDGGVAGLTLRVGRFVAGSSTMIADILFGTELSILFLGPPDSGKTSILRDAARALAEKQSVVIVDTTCEIGGAGIVPHECIGLARRMQVRCIDEQSKAMIEAVQNHTPACMIVDEIGRRPEVLAALACKERGARIIASAHGDLSGLVHSSTLSGLVGVAQCQRKGAPIFDVVVELKRGKLHEWQVVFPCAREVDSILANGRYNAQLRSRKDSEESYIGLRNITVLDDGRSIGAGDASVAAATSRKEGEEAKVGQVRSYSNDELLAMDLSDLTYRALQVNLKGRGEETKGKIAELRDRLKDFLERHKGSSRRNRMGERPGRTDNVKQEQLQYSNDELRTRTLSDLPYRTLQVCLKERGEETEGDIAVLRDRLKDFLERQHAKNNVEEKQLQYSDDELRTMDLFDLNYLALQECLKGRGEESEGDIAVLRERLKDFLERQDAKNRTTCPVCKKLFVSRTEMLEHALAKTPCKRRLDEEVAAQFHTELWGDDDA